MAVQAQYPSNVLLFNRGDQELKKEMDLPPLQQPPLLLDQSGGIFFSNGVENQRSNARKRGRKTATATASTRPPQFINLATTQPHPLVSTGLRLASSNPVLFDDLNQQSDEMNQLLIAQGEQLRRSLTDAWQRHYRALVGAAEGAAARSIRDKEAEVERAARRGADLEGRIGRLRAETMAWQAKAMADQATAAALHAQLQIAAAAAAAAEAVAPEECGESPDAGDAGSAHVDPDRVGRLESRVCRACRGRGAAVVVLPCRHLCLCAACDAAAAAGEVCPVCRCLRTGSVEVFLS